MDLFAASKDLLINYRDLFVIFNPTDEINVNNHLLLPINSPPWGEGGDFWQFCSLIHLACSPSLSKVITTLSFGHCLSFLFDFGSSDPQHTRHVNVTQWVDI